MTSFGIKGKFDTKCKRSGLTYQQENILYEAIQPGHPANPWGSKAQLRNCMIVNMLLATGMRRDELLSLRIPDIDFRQNVIAIRSLYRSNVTRSRVLPINGYLAELVRDYILSDRGKLKDSGSHDYLAVSIIDGSALSGSAFNNIFTAVRDRVPGIPLNFSGNLCRHTWKDRICDYRDLNGIVGQGHGMLHPRTTGGGTGSKMAILYIKKSMEKWAQAETERCISLKEPSDEPTSGDLPDD